MKEGQFSLAGLFHFMITLAVALGYVRFLVVHGTWAPAQHPLWILVTFIMFWGLFAIVWQVCVVDSIHDAKIKKEQERKKKEIPPV